MLTTYATPVLLSGLMLYMAFIVFRLGSDSKAEKFRMFVLFMGLRVGVIGLGIEYVIKYFIEGDI